MPKTLLSDKEIVQNLLEARDAVWQKCEGKPIDLEDPNSKMLFEFNRILYRSKPKTDAERIKELERRVAEIEKCM